jgi:radical SAM superfamily enzyme YgiQ (UPF0313 family)
MLVRPRTRTGWGFLFAPVALNLEYIAGSILDVVDEVRIVNQEFDGEPIERHIADFSPDLFGVTMSATEHYSGLDLCKRAKRAQPGLKTIVGGFHPNAMEERMLSEDVDMVAVGEAELTMRELVQKGDPAGVEGVLYRDETGAPVKNPRRPFIKDLDTLPFPARHLRAGNECELSLKRWGIHRDQVHTSRGCWGKCTFCCEPLMSGSRQRHRRPEKVFEEIRQVYDLHHREKMFILFGDPHFMGAPKLAERLCDLLIDADMDIEFTAMVRADMIARFPKVAEKMVRAGIIGYCLGLESPAAGDLGSTKKGITPQAQFDAIRILRRNHAVAGGTFVCGLSAHNEREILMFPEYARRLGMINAAFPVATPHFATEFYNELDAQGLIEDENWEHYDQMHRVFRHEKLTPKRSEELLTQCLGRFYALDIFLDDIIARQGREAEGRKITFRGAVGHFLERMTFIREAGSEYETHETGTRMARVFLGGQVNPHTRIRTQKMGIHNIVDLDNVLPILGDQKLCITVRQAGEPFAHYVLKTSADRVEYLDITAEPQPDATVGIELDLEDVTGKRRRPAAAIGAKMAKKILKKSRWSSLARGTLAVFAEHLRNRDRKSSRKPMELPEGFFEHFCQSDGWDDEKYAAVRGEAPAAGNREP